MLKKGSHVLLGKRGKGQRQQERKAAVTMDEGPAKPYIVEYAKTGRAGCTILPTQHTLFPKHRPCERIGLCTDA